MASRPLAAPFPAYHRTPPWERPLTLRQSYWLGCLRVACAAVKAETGHDLPASLHRLLKVDAARNGGMPTTSPSTVIATMRALADRRWVEACLLPPELAPRDQRQSRQAFKLADRSALCNDEAELAKLQAERGKLDVELRRAKAALGNFRGTFQDEIELARVNGAIAANEKRTTALRAQIEARESEAPSYEVDVPIEYQPIPQLLKACEPRTARAATPNPYAE